jgi:NDP-sugar pyrophosphorylase family protein
MTTDQYVNSFARHFSSTGDPWHFTRDLQFVLQEKIKILSSDFHIRGDIAIHRSATVEEGVILKGPVIICADVFVGAHAYLRGGAYLSPGVSVGPGCEIKTSVIFEKSSLAHFNFAGDSIIGSDVNMEAGSIIANHHNDRTDKTIRVRVGKSLLDTDAIKFGALIGDGCRIGANAVLCPGTILPKGTIVRRLELVCQE